MRHHTFVPINARTTYIPTYVQNFIKSLGRPNRETGEDYGLAKIKNLDYDCQKLGLI